MTEVPFRLQQPRTAVVEPVNPSGETPSGIWVFDHDQAKGLDGRSISLLQRVVAVHPACAYVKPGDVVGIVNPYAFSTITHEGVDYRIISEKNVEYCLEGYDDDESAGYPVCGKA